MYVNNGDAQPQKTKEEPVPAWPWKPRKQQPCACQLLVAAEQWGDAEKV